MGRASIRLRRCKAQRPHRVAELVSAPACSRMHVAFGHVRLHVLLRRSFAWSFISANTKNQSPSVSVFCCGFLSFFLSVFLSFCLSFFLSYIICIYVFSSLLLYSRSVLHCVVIFCLSYFVLMMLLGRSRSRSPRHNVEKEAMSSRGSPPSKPIRAIRATPINPAPVSKSALQGNPATGLGTKAKAGAGPDPQSRQPPRQVPRKSCPPFPAHPPSRQTPAAPLAPEELRRDVVGAIHKTMQQNEAAAYAEGYAKAKDEAQDEIQDTNYTRMEQHSAEAYAEGYAKAKAEALKEHRKAAVVEVRSAVDKVRLDVDKKKQKNGG